MKKDPRFQPVDAAVTPRFAGIATFMRTQRHDVSSDLDIALVGVPFDIGVNYRAGARQGPAAVREASRLIRRVHSTSGIAPYDLCNVADVGDAPVNPIDLARSIAMIEAFFAQIHAAGARPLSIGGDHTVPLPILRALAKDQPVGIFHIDSHADTLDTLADTRINHATTFRRGVEEGLIDPKRTIQIGLRGSRFSPDDIRWGQDAGFTCITFDEYEAMGRDAVIRKIQSRFGQGADLYDHRYRRDRPGLGAGDRRSRDRRAHAPRRSGDDPVAAGECTSWVATSARWRRVSTPPASRQ